MRREAEVFGDARKLAVSPQISALSFQLPDFWAHTEIHFRLKQARSLGSDTVH